MGMPVRKELPRLVLDAALAETVIQSVQKSLGSIFSSVARPGQFRLVQDFEMKGDISGLVGMVQEKMEAVLLVTFQKEMICKMLSRLYEREFTEMDNSVKQGVGELTNIIYSLVKKSLNDRGYQFKLTIPNVIMGNQHTVVSLHESGRTMIIPFQTDIGTFHVEITIQPVIPDLLKSDLPKPEKTYKLK